MKKKNHWKRWLVVSVFLILLVAVVLVGVKAGIRKYTITFDDQKQEGVDYWPDAQTVSFGSKAICPPFPVKEVGIFGGWYTDEACTKEYDFSKRVTKDLTLYAGWVDEDSEEARLTEEEYTLFFHSTEQIHEICQELQDEKGYVKEEDADEFLYKVEEYAAELKKEGTITYYRKENGSVYMEFASMIPYVVTPAIEGYDSAGDGEVMVTMDPFSDERVSDDEAKAEEARGSRAAEYGMVLRDALEDRPYMKSYGGESVTLEEMEDLSECDYLLWHGHGGYIGEDSYLVTGEELSLFDDVVSALKPKFAKKILVVAYVSHDEEAESRDGHYIGITSRFFEGHDFLKEGALVYLATCQSGQDEKLADSLIKNGADTVFVNRGTQAISTAYDQLMTELIIRYMSGGGNVIEDGDVQKEADGIYHTAGEALQCAHDFMSWFCKTKYQYTYQGCDTIYDSSEKKVVSKKGVYVDIVGEPDYTICSGIKGQVVSGDGSVNLSEIRLEVDGAEENPVIPQKDQTFYFNKLDPGNYILKIFYKGKQAGVLDGLTVRTHRYLDLEEIDLRMLNAEIIVVDEDTGEKIKNADVKYVINTNFTSEQTDQNGKISLKDMVVADEGKVSANYEFDIFAEGYSSKNCVITVNDGDSKVVKLKKAEIRIPDGAVKFREHSYYLYEAGTVSTYEEALQFCTERGGHLATISSQAENDFVYAYITQMDCWSAYFGLSDADEEETWKWCNGERVSYTNWHGNEPNGENPNEDYGQFYYKYKDGTWNDGDFGRQTVNDITAFICEWDIINVY